jgi:hypothetical protein
MLCTSLGAFQFWGKLQKAAINAHFALATSTLSLSKDAVLDQKRPFQDPSRFDKPLDRLGGHLSVAMPR